MEYERLTYIRLHVSVVDNWEIEPKYFINAMWFEIHHYSRLTLDKAL